MPNLTSALNDQIRRLSRREITGQTRGTRKLVAQYRRDIAALKRQVSELTRRLARVERQEKRQAGEAPEAIRSEGLRFRADGLRSHRGRLGLSAEDYGRLVGASGLSIYHWEAGRVRPRAKQVAKLAAIRGLGKREALKRLEQLNGQA